MTKPKKLLTDYLLGRKEKRAASINVGTAARGATAAAVPALITPARFSFRSSDLFVQAFFSLTTFRGSLSSSPRRSTCTISTTWE